MSGAPTIPVNLLDPAVHATQDLTAYWRMLRHENPVSWHPVDRASGATAEGFWVVTRHPDIIRVVHDTQTFTSLHGNMLGTLLKGGDTASGKMLVVSEGSWHTALRRLLAGGLGPRSLGPVADATAVATRELLAALVARGGGDFVAEVAAQIPLRAICGLLGVPEADQSRVLDLTNTAMLGEENEDVGLEAQIAQSEILLYYARLAAERRTVHGRDDRYRRDRIDYRRHQRERCHATQYVPAGLPALRDDDVRATCDCTPRFLGGPDRLHDKPSGVMHRVDIALGIAQEERHDP